MDYVSSIIIYNTDRVCNTFLMYDAPDQLDCMKCKLALNGSNEYKVYDIEGIKKLYKDGCSGILFLEKAGSNVYDRYVIYKTSKAGVALMSCMQYLGCSEEIPKELYNEAFDENYFNQWGIPLLQYDSDTGCVLSVMFLDKAYTEEKFDVQCPAHLIFQYYKTSMKLGRMIDFNIDVLSDSVYNQSSVPDGGSFYYRKSMVFKGRESTFGKKGYIDCVMNDHVYRLHRRDVFQYVGCPMYIDDSGYLYIGYLSDSEYEEDPIIGGTIKYKIIDVDKFKLILSKAMFSNSIDYTDMFSVFREIDVSPVRLKE